MVLITGISNVGNLAGTTKASDICRVRLYLQYSGFIEQIVARQDLQCLIDARVGHYNTDTSDRPERLEKITVSNLGPLGSEKLDEMLSCGPRLWGFGPEEVVWVKSRDILDILVGDAAF